MPLQMTAPLYDTFDLERSDKQYDVDPTEPTQVTIKQARQHEHEARERQFSQIERKMNPNDDSSVSIVQNFAIEELRRLEVYLTLCECNILNEDGKPLFPSIKGKDHPKLKVTKDQFRKAWGTLPPDVAEEIHEKVLEVNPQWAPEGEES
jgi:hypothetical protein